MEDYIDSNHERLRDGFYIGKEDNSALLLYISRRGENWIMEMPGTGEKYKFNPEILAREVKRVNNIDELLRTTREDLMLSKHLFNYSDDEELQEFPNGLIPALDRFLFVQTRVSKN
jgi:hypothetical protein